MGGPLKIWAHLVCNQQTTFLTKIYIYAVTGTNPQGGKAHEKDVNINLRWGTGYWAISCICAESGLDSMWSRIVYGQSFLRLPRISFALNNCVEVCGSNQLVSPLLLGTVAHELLLWLLCW